MSTQRVREYFEQFGIAGRVRELALSTATVELAAAAIGCEGARIAKTLALRAAEPGQCTLIVAAGDTRLDNRLFKARFGLKARMLAPEETPALTGYAVGGVCPFGVPAAAGVYLDESLRRFKSVYPACGAANSMIELSLGELERYSGSRGWVDVCAGWR